MLTELITLESLEVQISVTQQAFETLAQIRVFPVKDPLLPGRLEEVFAARLGYLGERTGAVRLECTPGVAFAVTRCLISESQPTSLDSDVRDAIGELVNTIGGNLKGLLPTGVRLKTPEVSTGQPFDPSDTECLTCTTFESQFGSFRLLLLAN